MSHRFFVAPDQVRDENVTFTGEQAHQLRHVLRLRLGDAVRVFDGTTDTDHFVRLDSWSTGRIEGTQPHAPEPRTRLVAYPALLQRDKFETVLQKLTELGVAGIVPVLTTRSLVRQQPDDARLTRWQSVIREAAEQSGRGRVPRLGQPAPFAEALWSATSTGPTIVADVGERQRGLREVLRNLSPSPLRLALYVGPEGGYTREEVHLAESAGAHLVSLGPRILRTETASPVLAALVLYELDDLSSMSS